MIDPQTAQTVLNRLAYYDGPMDGDLKSDASVKAIKLFQRDHGLSSDGIIGEKQTSPALVRRAAALKFAPEAMQQARRWRMTSYYVESEHNEDGGHSNIPVYDKDSNVLAKVTPRLFALMSLQGTAKMLDGRLLNVAGSYVSVNADLFEPVRQFAIRNNWTGRKYGYAGIVVDGERVTKAFAFHVVPESQVGNGYGTTRGIPLSPYYTVAADNGTKSSHDPQFRGTGGLVPVGTKVWVLDLAGRQLPDGSIHDGWVTSSDTGGAIFGAHFDLFVGEKSLYDQFSLAGRSFVWWEGCEEKIPASYSYGL